MADIKRKCYTPDIKDLLPEREYKCPIGCPNKVYKSRNLYNMHLQKVHNQPIKLDFVYGNEFHCPIEGCLYHCEKKDGKSFRQMHTLRVHYQRIHMLKKFQCKKCKEEFFVEQQLLAHRCHIIDYKCAKCQMMKRRSILDNPYRTRMHGGDSKKDVKTHVCKNCEKNSLSRSNRILKQFRLKCCGKNRPGSKTRPAPGKSPGKRIYKRCDKCKKRFLYKHLCRQHVCFICPHIFSGKSALNLHLNRHYYRNPLIDNDQVFLEEMEHLLKGIECNEVQDSSLIEELLNLLPLLLSASE